MRFVRPIGAVATLAAVAFALGSAAAGAQSHTSKPFSGVKVNGGTATHSVRDGQHVLTLSSDFKVPDAPDPHWQVIDSSGRTFLLDRLPVKGALAGVAGDRIKMSITLPAYVEDVAKVQIYCSWAEALLGEAAFETKVLTRARR
jgi:hypothetical protein